MFRSFRRMWVNYCVFQGRTGKNEFWKALFCHLIILAVLSGAMNYVGAYNGVFYRVIGVYSLASFLPVLGLTVRRFHDLDKSWTQILYILIPVFGLLLILFKCVEEGTDQANRYGPALKTNQPICPK